MIVDLDDWKGGGSRLKASSNIETTNVHKYITSVSLHIHQTYHGYKGHGKLKSWLFMVTYSLIIQHFVIVVKLICFDD